MSFDVDRRNPVFEQVIPIRFEKSLGIGIKNVSNAEIDAIIRILKGKTQDGQELLHMEITSERETFFLYTLSVSEDEFLELKHDQSLLVDFKSFPGKFVELLECCRSNHERKDLNKESHTLPIPAFFAVLSLLDGKPLFKIIEANQFKQLTHLGLRFLPGTDETIKSYLSGRLKQSITESEERQRLLEQVQEELSILSLQYSNLKNAHDKLQSEYDSSILRMTQEHKTDLEAALTQQKEESLKLLHQTQQASAEQAHKQQVDANKRIEKLERELKDSNELKSSLETEKTNLEVENRKISSKLAALDKCTTTNEEELQHLRHQNRELESKIFEFDKNCAKQELTISSLKNQLLDKEEVVKKTSALLEAANDRKASAEEKLDLYKQNTTKLQRKLELSISEINKGNSIIEKQQGEFRAFKHKLKMKNTVIRQQEKAIEQFKQMIDKNEREIFRLNNAINSEKTTSEQLRLSLKESQKRLEDCNRLLESNQNVIDYLNKQINEVNIHERFGNEDEARNVLSMNLNPALEDHGRYNIRSPSELAVESKALVKQLDLQGFESFPDPSTYDNEEMERKA